MSLNVFCNQDRVGQPITAIHSTDHSVVIPMLTDAEIVLVAVYGLGNMPGGYHLSAQDYADVLAYVRVTFQ